MGEAGDLLPYYAYYLVSGIATFHQVSLNSDATLLIT